MSGASDPVACENEPIHTPGSIQPFGVLLALDVGTLTVRHVSTNSQDIFGNGAVPLGSTAAEILGPAAEAALRNGLAENGLIVPRRIPGSIPGTGPQRWQGAAHCLAGMVFVELEPAIDAATTSADWLAAFVNSVTRLSADSTVSAFAATVAREVRSLTGYDRVMVYRFDDEWNGKVIAEERRADLETFLGLHYPASDIPSQARALFLFNRLRVIPDAACEQIPLVPDCDGSTGLPLDLSRCLLRSVSPIHREYMHNMGVRASLTASLVIGDRLWGLIACHHLTPRCPSPTEREACALVAQVASTHIAFLSEVEDRENLGLLTEALRRTGARIGATTPPIAALAKNTEDLLALVGANGAVVWRAGRGMPIGQTPPDEALPGLLDWIKNVAAPLIATDRLSSVYSEAKSFASEASGLLVVEVSRATDEYLLWFRHEVLQTVNWGGDPHGKSDSDGRLSPRRSFAMWKETVTHRSLPWRPAEVENATRVKNLVQAAASQSAARLEALVPMCAWCKKVRDEPDYWRGVEEYISDLADVRFSHGICPDCMSKQIALYSARPAPGQSHPEREAS